MQRLKGRTVTVIRHVKQSSDGFGADAYTEVSESVDGVLVEPLSTDEVFKNMQNGVRVSLRLHFPKAYLESLKDADVEILGHRYKVLGNPQRYQSELVPSKWDLPVEVEEYDG